jgi:hypothetical protein
MLKKDCWADCHSNHAALYRDPVGTLEIVRTPNGIVFARKGIDYIVKDGDTLSVVRVRLFYETWQDGA